MNLGFAMCIFCFGAAFGLFTGTKWADDAAAYNFFWFVGLALFWLVAGYVIRRHDAEGLPTHQNPDRSHATK